METGDIVISRAGHDSGKPFVVIARASADFVLIADGKSRPVANPKLKRVKHLTVAQPSGIASPTDTELKKRLKKFISERRKYAEK